MATPQYRGCIYLATNTTNGSVYIGKSLMGLHRRRKTHFAGMRAGAKQPFACALRKHGEDAFVWCELFNSDDHAALMAAEMELIASYKAAGYRMYNATAGGDGASRKRSAAEIERMKLKRISERHKQQLRDSWTPERRQAQAEKMRNRTVTASDRQKMSESRKGMKFSADHCESIRLSKLGNTHRLGTGKKRTPRRAL